MTRRASPAPPSDIPPRAPAIITALERTPRRRGRIDVYLDGVRAFDLSRDTVRKRSLRPGMPLDAAQIEAVVAADARATALRTAGDLLARRMRSERELRQALARRRFDAGVVDETLARLRAARFLDDAQFARSFAESRDRASPRGKRLIAQELRARGIDRDLAASATAGVSDDDAAFRAAWRRAQSLAFADHATFRARLAGLLQRRGFGWDTVRRTIERCQAELGRPNAGDDLDAAVE
ncbi:MAG TPA: RecX family transcriptional regulator [Dehalococcoidia bacterium]|nr:RecX family transcriptional regulator [Dehalococcoidia bacterium]